MVIRPVAPGAPAPDPHQAVVALAEPAAPALVGGLALVGLLGVAGAGGLTVAGRLLVRQAGQDRERR